MMSEADPAVELRIPGQTLFHAGRADENQPDIAPVEEITNVFESCGGQTFHLVDDHELDMIKPAIDFDYLLATGFVLTDAAVRSGQQLLEVSTQCADAERDRWRVEDRAGERQCGIHVDIGAFAGSPFEQQRLGAMPIRVQQMGYWPESYVRERWISLERFF